MTDYKLVTVEPTPEMVEAANDAYMPFGDMEMALRMPLLAAPAVQGEPVGWQYYQDGKWWNGDDRIKDHRKNTEEAGYLTRDVYAAPQPAEQQPSVQKPVGFVSQDFLEGKWSLDHIAKSDEGQISRTIPVFANPPQPAPDVAELVEARELLLIFRGVIGGATWTLDDEDKELAVRVEKAVTALATHKDSLTVQPNPPDVAGLVEALERFVEAWTDCQQQPVHAEEFEILTDICEDSLKALAAHRKQEGGV